MTNGNGQHFAGREPIIRLLSDGGEVSRGAAATLRAAILRNLSEGAFRLAEQPPAHPPNSTRKRASG